MRGQTGGIENAGNFLILEEGMKWQQVGLDMEDLQFLETRKMNKHEICTLFRVPPHMVGDLEAGAAYSSVEEMGEDFVTYTLRPWFVRWEQAIARDLIDDPGNVRSLLRRRLPAPRQDDRTLSGVLQCPHGRLDQHQRNPRQRRPEPRRRRRRVQ